MLPIHPEQVDWRRGLGRGLRFAPAPLPDEFSERILVFMKEMGLRYGAIDAIVRPDGEIVFLEVNPQGTYLWLERELNIPITQAIAHSLVDGL